MTVTQNQEQSIPAAEDSSVPAKSSATETRTAVESDAAKSPKITVAPNPLSRSDISGAPDADEKSGKIPSLKIGLMGGLVGMLCCVGPTVLAIVGVVSATTAHAWANDLYGNYAWLFRLGGLLVMAGLIAYTLKRKNQCNVQGARNSRRRIFLALGIAVGTYLFLYALTTWLGSLAT